MDSIKKKMEKLSNETADAESRIAHFEEIKAQNEAEADKFEEQVKSEENRSKEIVIKMLLFDNRCATSKRRCKPWRAPSMSVLKTFSIRLLFSTQAMLISPLVFNILQNSHLCRNA